MFLQNYLRVPRYPKISSLGYLVLEITEKACLIIFDTIMNFTQNKLNRINHKGKLTKNIKIVEV